MASKKASTYFRKKKKNRLYYDIDKDLTNNSNYFLEAKRNKENFI